MRTYGKSGMDLYEGEGSNSRQAWESLWTWLHGSVASKYFLGGWNDSCSGILHLHDLLDIVWRNHGFFCIRSSHRRFLDWNTYLKERILDRRTGIHYFANLLEERNPWDENSQHGTLRIHSRFHSYDGGSSNSVWSRLVHWRKTAYIFLNEQAIQLSHLREYQLICIESNRGLWIFDKPIPHFQWSEAQDKQELSQCRVIFNGINRDAVRIFEYSSLVPLRRND